LHEVVSNPVNVTSVGLSVVFTSYPDVL